LENAIIYYLSWFTYIRQGVVVARLVSARLPAACRRLRQHSAYVLAMAGRLSVYVKGLIEDVTD
jgi:hypothetical protein